MLTKAVIKAGFRGIVIRQDHQTDRRRGAR